MGISEVFVGQRMSSFLVTASVLFEIYLEPPGQGYSRWDTIACFALCVEMLVVRAYKSLVWEY